MNNNKLDILKTLGSGFKTPEDYFERIDASVYTKLLLDKFPEKEGFKLPLNYLESIEDRVISNIKSTKRSNSDQAGVPEGYFDTIEDRVFDKLKGEVTKEPKVINLTSKFLKIAAPIAIAASLLVFVVLNYNRQTYSIENLATSDIEAWIEDDLIALDSYEISTLYNDVDLEDEISSDDLDMLNYVNGTDIESALLTD